MRQRCAARCIPHHGVAATQHIARIEPGQAPVGSIDAGSALTARHLRGTQRAALGVVEALHRVLDAAAHRAQRVALGKRIHATPRVIDATRERRPGGPLEARLIMKETIIVPRTGEMPKEREPEKSERITLNG